MQFFIQTGHIAFPCITEECVWGKDKGKLSEGPGLKPVPPQIDSLTMSRSDPDRSLQNVLLTALGFTFVYFGSHSSTAN